MEFTGFGPGTTAFLADLATHQDRAWFAENRARYDRELLDKQRAFVDAIGAAFSSVDPRVQAVPAVDRSIFRIFRDVRFSRDKSPYKTYSDVFFWIGSDRRSAPCGTLCATVFVPPVTETTVLVDPEDGFNAADDYKPGDTFEMEIRFKEKLSNACFFDGVAKVHGKTAVQIEFACAVVPKDAVK